MYYYIIAVWWLSQQVFLTTNYNHETEIKENKGEK